MSSNNLVFSELRSLLNSSTPWDASQAAHYRTLLDAVRADGQTRLLMEEVWAPVGRAEDLLVPWVRPVHRRTLIRPSAHWLRSHWLGTSEDASAWVWAGDWLPTAPSRWVRAQAWEASCRWSWEAWAPGLGPWTSPDSPALTSDTIALMISPPGRYWVEVLGEEGVFPLEWGGKDERDAALQGELDRIFPAPPSRFMSGGIKLLMRIFEDREHRARLVRAPSEIPRR